MDQVRDIAVRRDRHWYDTAARASSTAAIMFALASSVGFTAVSKNHKLDLGLIYGGVGGIMLSTAAGLAFARRSDDTFEEHYTPSVGAVKRARAQIETLHQLHVG